MASAAENQASIPRSAIIKSSPGVKRDGTPFEGSEYTDGQWMRFNDRGRPRKMNGYRLMNSGVPGVPRGLHVHRLNNVVRIHAGHSAGIQQQQFTPDAVFAGGPFDRTPVGLAANANYVWQMDVVYDSTGAGSPRILAHPGQNGSDVSSSAASQLYYGAVDGTGALIDAGAPAVSGGVCVLHPFTFVYGDNGLVAWSDAGLPATWSGGYARPSNRITENKIIVGKRARGGSGQSPSGLFWSLDSLLRCTFVGGSPIFSFDHVAVGVGPISSSSVVEFDGIFYWPTTDRFLSYNGTVREVPNRFNRDWFFDNLNFAARQRVISWTVPRWGEIWWAYPRGNATECTHAVCYNVRQNIWYDTQLPASGRSSAFYSSIFRFPVLGDVTPNPNAANTYALWQHEHPSYNEITDITTNAVQSFYESGALNLIEGWSRNLRVLRFLPDMIQAGDVTVSRVGRSFPRSEAIVRSATMADSVDKLDAIRGQARQTRIRVESNALNGFYEVGDCLVEVDAGDVRPAGQ
jgi:hypothetical protein